MRGFLLYFPGDHGARDSLRVLQSGRALASPCRQQRPLVEGCWDRDVARRRNLGWEVHQSATCHAAPKLQRTCLPWPHASTFCCKAELLSLFFPLTDDRRYFTSHFSWAAQQLWMSVSPVAVNPYFVSSVELSHLFPPLLIWQSKPSEL